MSEHPRRDFVRGALAAAGIGAAASPAALAQAGSAALPLLPAYARAQHYRSLKQSSYDRTGGNRDSWSIPAGGVQGGFPRRRRRRHQPHLVHHRRAQRASSEGTGAARLLGRQRQAQRGNADRRFLRPESRPIIGFTNPRTWLARPANRSTAISPCPTAVGARLTVTNEGKQGVGAFYSNIDYMAVPSRCPRTRCTFTRSTGRRRRACRSRAKPRS